MACRRFETYQNLKLVSAVVLLIAVCLRQAEASTGWDYSNGPGGPSNWKTEYSDCGGVMQSPINITDDLAVYAPKLPLFDFTDYGITSGVSMSLTNVGGHTAQLIPSGTQQYLKGGGLPSLYLFRQLHFHWGDDLVTGSEHSLNGKFFPLEIHFVHSQARLPSMAEAAGHPHGLAVVGAGFKIGNKNEDYEPIIQNLKNIKNPDDSVPIQTFSIGKLLPKVSRLDFYRYDGSLTTPPCYESVIWSFLADPIEISAEQLEEFRTLTNHEHEPLDDGYRPIQNLNGRTILTTINHDG